MDQCLFFFLCCVAIAASKEELKVKNASFGDNGVAKLSTVVEKEATPNIPQLVEILGLTNLSAYLKEYELDEILAGKGPFTLFAPTNAALQNIRTDFKPWIEKAGGMANVLKYHALARREMFHSFEDNLEIPTLYNQSNRITLYPKLPPWVPPPYKPKKIKVAAAQCAPLDLARVNQSASNGVVHVTNQVMIPPFGNLMETLLAMKGVEVGAKFFETCILNITLRIENNITVFVPTNQAFANFKKEYPKEYEQLATLSYLRHTYMGNQMTFRTWCSAGITTGTIMSAVGSQLDLIRLKDKIMVGKYTIVSSDYSATNGVIHIIDGVNIPNI